MYKLNEEKMFYDIADGVAIIIDFTTGIYYGFNSFGTALIDAFLTGADEAGLTAVLLKKDGCPADIGRTIEDFATKLLDKGIILKTDGDSSVPEIKDEYLAEGFEPVVDDFSDVRDLIIADPVHEVDAGNGWPEPKSFNTEEDA